MLQYATIQYKVFKPYAASKMELFVAGWKLLLTVFTEIFVLNMTGFLGLLDLYKCIDLDPGNKLFHLPLACSKSAEKYTRKCHSQQ